jgi:hypothetical protein
MTHPRLPNQLFRLILGPICFLLMIAGATEHRHLTHLHAADRPGVEQIEGDHGASGVREATESPEDFLGRPVGTDFKLADWEQVSRFYRQLASSSPHVLLEEAGKTTEGREFLIAIISDEQNLERLDEIKAHARIIADPRGATDDEKQQAISEGKVIVFITPTMHATETAATEMGMQLAWLLATSDEEPWRSARQDAVVVITPSLNPDGVDHVVHWYREHVGTNLEGSSLTKLYQYYTGHDNNRDWFMLTQVETQLLTRLLYHEWFPQFFWDVHQQGNSTERFFVPPYRDPLNPNLDPGIVAGINLIGTRAVMDMTRDGLTGIASGVSYDNWWNGGNRSVPGRHNIIGILTEAASVNIASPIFQAQSSLKDPLGTGKYQPSNQFLRPWPGGWWRLGDIISYELAFGRSLLASVSREREFWLRNAMEAAQRSIAAGLEGGPRGWLVTVDNPDLGASRRLIDVLLASGVEVHVASDSFEADDRQYPAGTIIIWRDQPYGNYVKDLFELQQFPSGTKPYDVTGWTLPLLMGVRRVQVSGQFTASSEKVEDAGRAIAAFPGDRRLGKSNAVADKGDSSTTSSTEDSGEDGGSDSDDIADSAEVFSLLDSDTWTKLVKKLGNGEKLRLLTDKNYAGLVAAGSKGDENTDRTSIQLSKMPRIGVYSPWAASMDEGWLRWVLDHFEIPFTVVRNEALRAGELGELFDVLIISSISGTQLNRGRGADNIPLPLAGGLDPEGSLAIEEFVREGGSLIAMDSSCAWVIELLGLPLVDVTKGAGAKGFSCPGSVLRGIVKPNPLTTGLPNDVPLFFSNSTGFRAMTKAERDAAGYEDRPITTLLSYAPTRLLLSGYIESPKTLEGHGAWVSVGYGKGNAHLFGFRPHYRAWSQATFHLLFRAAVLARAEADDER